MYEMRTGRSCRDESRVIAARGEGRDSVFGVMGMFSDWLCWWLPGSGYAKHPEFYTFNR